MMTFLRARTRVANLVVPSDAVAVPAGQTSFDMPSIKDSSAPRRPVASCPVLARLSFGTGASEGHRRATTRGASLRKSPPTCRPGVGRRWGTAHPCRSSYAREVSPMSVCYADCVVPARLSASPGIGAPAEKHRTNNVRTVGRSVGATRPNRGCPARVSSYTDSPIARSLFRTNCPPSHLAREG